MFPNAKNVAITGGNFWSTTELRITTAFEKLQNASAMGAMHDSSARFDPPKCHPNTRVAVLEYLLGWIFGHNDPEALILWLYGPAGAGKSAILQTIAEICAERKSILASFFFGRSDPTRNTFKPLIPTIACQIAIALPEIRPLIELVIERDPIIFDKSLTTQLQSLIIQPLKDLSASENLSKPETTPRLVVIDGLDECNDPKIQSTIVREIAQALRRFTVPPLKFLIASRPEQCIIHAFNSAALKGLWRSLVLDDAYKPDDDIRLFLTESFEEIKTSRTSFCFPVIWPSQSDIDALVSKSSGQFIYASTVVKYVADDNDSPLKRLQVITELCPPRHEIPFAELDALYIHILNACSNKRIVKDILGLLLIGIHEVYAIEMLLDIPPGDASVFLIPLNSMMKITNQKGLCGEVALFHASLGDFLTDISRCSTEFYIDMLTLREITLRKCTKILLNPCSVDNSRPFAQLSLYMLVKDCIIPCLDPLPLYEGVGEILKNFSLPKVWNSWGSIAFLCGLRSVVVWNFLAQIEKMISENVDTVHLEEIYDLHLSSFEEVFTSEIEIKYWENKGLTALLVLSQISCDEYNHKSTNLGKTLPILLQLTDELQMIDRCSLNLLVYFDDNFFTGLFGHSIILTGQHYAKTALAILEFLCKKPPHHTPYHKSSRHPQWKNVSPITTRCSSHKEWKTGIHSFRQQRAWRHQRGVKLSIPEDEGPTSLFSALDLGLCILPQLLEQSSHDLELSSFILSHGKKIAFLPNLTQVVIRAMHEYLNRFDSVF